MPPRRRRRPVQPATRVRLPRAGRPRPGADAPDATAPENVAPDAAALSPSPDAGAAAGREAPPASEVRDEAAGLAGDKPSGPAGPAVDEAAGLSEDAPADATLEAEVPADEAPEAGDEGIGADDTHEDAKEADSEPEGGRRSAPGGVTGAARRLPLVPVCLGVVTVILGGLATWFGLEAGSVGNGVDTRNVALVNAAATREVSQQIDAAVNTIFSYNYADTAKTKQAAASLLTGKASQQYNTLFKLVTADAPQEKLVLTTTVTNSGVESLEGNLARLLIFVNQSDTSNATHKTTAAGAMFAVSAVREGGSWKIASIDEFAGT